MTGVQALERAAPTRPVRPRAVERREFEYLRHGTPTLIATCFVVTGQVFPRLGPTRTAEDFAAYLAVLFALRPPRTQWHLVMDNLDIYCSEALVRRIAEPIGTTSDFGVEGHSGTLESMATRTAFLSDPSHRIVFHFTPKHVSRRNRIEPWFSIPACKTLRRGNFISVEDLERRIGDFIDLFNRTPAKPFHWTHEGKPPAASMKTA